MLFSFTKNLSEFFYQIVIDPREGGNSESYNEIFVKNSGMEWCLFFLLGIVALFVIGYYFGWASKARNATIGNYFTTYVCGFVTLVIVTYLGLTAIVGSNVFGSFNVFKICLINIFWYTVLFEILSLLVKDLSKASNIHLWSIIFNK